MSDPVLTSLCGICHVKAPRYKCPRCNARTCSIACVKKHKNWSSCSGERDPTVYIPPARLRTDAGIDHDYNFLTKIERKVEQAEKILTEERHVLPERSATQSSKRARVGKGQSRGKSTFGDELRPWAKMALHRLRELRINLTQQPYGMSRAKENTSSFNKRTGQINWQVEWIFANDRPSSPTVRLLSKMLDKTPFYEGFADCQEQERRQRLTQEAKDDEKKMAAKRRKQQPSPAREQDLSTAAWRDSPAFAQDSTSACWNMRFVERRQQTLETFRVQAQQSKYQFFFHIPGTPSRNAQKLIPLKPTDTLESTLMGMEVLEFPTIHVLPTSSTLPEGYIIEQHPQSKPTIGNSRKRKEADLIAYGSSDDEEGEVNGTIGHDRDTGSDGDDTTSSSGSDTSEMEVD